MTNQLARLSELGVSIWLDDLSRERLEGGGAQSIDSLIRDDHVVGVTTNPSIFASALSTGNRYDADLRALAEEGADVPTAITALTTADVRSACNRFMPVYERTDGVDGRVSIEVDPYLDRKSTRLNSSHVATSYAVFCLKKRKNVKIGRALD